MFSSPGAPNFTVASQIAAASQTTAAPQIAAASQAAAASFEVTIIAAPSGLGHGFTTSRGPV